MSGRLLEDQVLDLLEDCRKPVTAPAITVALGGAAAGVLGERPEPDVAVALGRLLDDGRVEVLPACPVCGRVGEVWVLAGDTPDGGAPIVGPDLIETAAVLRPLIREGEIEVGERVELIEDECCMRAARPWRPTPPPA
jgi:hypothetical protein